MKRTILHHTQTAAAARQNRDTDNLHCIVRASSYRARTPSAPYTASNASEARLRRSPFLSTSKLVTRDSHCLHGAAAAAAAAAAAGNHDGEWVATCIHISKQS
eukprot:655531-Pelagomonas_calceolata.AAC.1